MKKSLNIFSFFILMMSFKDLYIAFEGPYKNWQKCLIFENFKSPKVFVKTLQGVKGAAN